MIDELELDEAHADIIVDMGIEYEVFTDEKPDNKKDLIEAAHTIVALAVDAWVTDEVRPDSDDKNVAAAGEQVQEILEAAGVEIDKKGNVSYGELPEIEGAAADDGDGDGDESAFDINDVIDGYEELSAASRIKAIKGLELDAEDEDDANTYVGIAEWEMAQSKPSSRVLDYLSDFVNLEGGGDEPEGDEPDAEEGDEGEVDTSDEPWEGYDDATVADIKKTITDASEDEEDPLTQEQVEYVIAYEQARDKPRSSLVKWLNDIIEPDEGEGGEELDAEADDAVARDDAKEKKSKSRKKTEDEDIPDFVLDEDDIESMVPSGLAGAYVQSKLHEERVRVSGLTPPSDWEGDMPELPDDIGTVDHDELSNLMLAFQSAHSTASWQSAKAYIHADIMEDIADYLENRALLGSEESNDTKRKAEAKTEPRVVAFRGAQKTAYHDYRRYQTLAADLEGKVKVVSRVGGFKDEDQETSDARPQRGDGGTSSRGTAKGEVKAKPAAKPAAKKPAVRPRIKK